MYTRLGFGDFSPEDDRPIKQCGWCLEEMDINSFDDLCSDKCAHEWQEHQAQKSRPALRLKAA